MRRCSSCDEEKDVSLFPDKYFTCKSCKAKRSREANKTPAKQLKTYEHSVRSKFGIGLKEVSDLLDIQRGCCAICKDSLVYPNSTKRYAIDHNHKTGKVRGLLCSDCNTALGKFRDNPDIVYNAFEYLLIEGNYAT